MLKKTGLPNELVFSRNNRSKSVSSKNANSRPASRRNNSNGKVDKLSNIGDNIEHTQKSGKIKDKKLAKSRKLSKSGKPKGEKLAKSKKLSKNGNSPNFGVIETGLKFLTPGAREAFN